MSIKFSPNKAARTIQRAAKQAGTPIVLHWIEWTGDRPDPDPVSGSTESTEDSEPVNRAYTGKAFVHFPQPSITGLRMSLEVAAGDCMVDALPDLLRVSTAGDTPFFDGQVVDAYQLRRANLDVMGDPAEAEAIVIDDLERLHFEINGLKWVQKKVGDKITKHFDAMHANVKLSRSVILELMP